MTSDNLKDALGSASALVLVASVTLAMPLAQILRDAPADHGAHAAQHLTAR